MREIRLYGSEGGEVMSLPDPYHLDVGRVAKWIPACAGMTA
jgi:hypothetical protein